MCETLVSQREINLSNVAIHSFVNVIRNVTAFLSAESGPEATCHDQQGREPKLLLSLLSTCASSSQMLTVPHVTCHNIPLLTKSASSTFLTLVILTRFNVSRPGNAAQRCARASHAFPLNTKDSGDSPDKYSHFH